MPSATPFHDLAIQLENIAADVRALADMVALGTFQVPLPPGSEPFPEPSEPQV